MEVLDPEKKNASLNLINDQTDIDEIYLYAKDPYAAKYQFTGLRHFNVLEAFIEYSINKMFTKLLKNTIEVRDV